MLSAISISPFWILQSYSQELSSAKTKTLEMFNFLHIFMRASKRFCVPGSAKSGFKHICSSAESTVHTQRHDGVGAKQAAGLLHMCLPQVKDGQVSGEPRWLLH